MSMPHAGARLATRLAFLVSGFGLACWAPLVPLAKDRLSVSDGTLGLLLLCLGLGSVGAMQIAGPFTAKFGARPAVLAGGFGQAVMLPSLAAAPTVPSMAVALALFGAFLGVIEVGMNVHAVEVEKQAGTPLMSGFHGLFSVGGFAGSMLLTLILSGGVNPVTGTAMASILMMGALLLAAPRLIPTPRTEETPRLVVPRGIVLLLAALAAIAFLAEGAVLDWGALLLSGNGLLSVSQAGLSYSAFALAMTAGRLCGDAVVAKLGDRRTMTWSGLLAIFGYVVMLGATNAPLALGGLALIGLGAANVVPVIFRRAGVQTDMPTGPAIASITTIGYAGILAGPAAIGFAAQAVGLPAAFWILTALFCLVPLCAKAATSNGRPS